MATGSLYPGTHGQGSLREEIRQGPEDTPGSLALSLVASANFLSASRTEPAIFRVWVAAPAVILSDRSQVVAQHSVDGK